MHEDNAATHPELLNTLTEQFKKSNFDVKYLLRAICNSETYQRTSRPTEGNGDDTVAYSHRRVRVLSPEQLFDSIVAAVGKVEPGKQPAPEPKKGPAITDRDGFVNFFRTDDVADPLEYQHGIPQVLRLMNSPQLNRNSQAVAEAMKEGKTQTGIIENLFLRTLLAFAHGSRSGAILRLCSQRRRCSRRLWRHPMGLAEYV